MKKIFKSIVIFVAMAICLVGVKGVFAADSLKLKISPLTFKFTLDQGKSDSGIVTVNNPNDFQIQVTSEKEDFLMENEEGVPKFMPEGADKTTLASWIAVSEKSFSLISGETKDVSFIVKVPAKGEPGGHYAAIFFKTAPQSDEGKTQLGISNRVGALILVSVPGDVSQTGEIAEFSAPKFVSNGPVDFLARFKNTGSVHYQLGGTIKIYNLFGKQSAEIKLPEHIVLPDSIRRFETKWDKKYLIGKYRATLEMKDGGGNIKTAQVSFFALPWKELSILIAALIILVLGIVLIKRKFKIVKKD